MLLEKSVGSSCLLCDHQVLKQQGRYEEAILALQEAQKAASDDPDTFALMQTLARMAQGKRQRSGPRAQVRLVALQNLSCLAGCATVSCGSPVYAICGMLQ